MVNRTLREMMSLWVMHESGAQGLMDDCCSSGDE